MKFAFPEDLGFDWDIGRLLVSKHVSVTMTDLTSLSFNDIEDLNKFLDVYEDAHARANRPQGGS